MRNRQSRTYKFGRIKEFLLLSAIIIESACSQQIYTLNQGTNGSFKNYNNSIVQNEKCYALALAGGGAKGAFQVGSLWQMARSLDENEIMYDVVSGISVGAINSGGLSLFPKGQEKEATQYLVDVWEGFSQSNLWKFWDKGWYDAFTQESGILDDSPLFEFIKQVLQNKSYQRKLIVGAVDLITGIYLNIDSDDLEQDEQAIAVLASASVPGLFPVTKFRDHYLIDGGSGWNLNIIGAIEKCHQLGFQDDKNIILDAIILLPEQIEVLNPNNSMNSFLNYMRYKYIKSHYQVLNDIAEYMQAHPNIQFRYFIQPSTSLLNEWEILDPNPAQNNRLIEQGKKDAQSVIDLGPGTSFQMFQQGFKNKQKSFKK